MGFIALLIPIMALSIPIIAILANSPVGKAMAERIHDKNKANPAQDEYIRRLEDRVRNLEHLTLSQGTDIQKLEQDYSFMSRLLEQKDSAGKPAGQD